MRIGFGLIGIGELKTRPMEAADAQADADTMETFRVGEAQKFHEGPDEESHQLLEARSASLRG